MTQLSAEKPKQGQKAAAYFANGTDGQLYQVQSPCCMWTAVQEVLLQLSEEQLFFRWSHDLSSQIIIFTPQDTCKNIQGICRVSAEPRLNSTLQSILHCLFCLF